MKKALKITGWIAVTIIGLLFLCFLLARFVFRQQVYDYSCSRLQRQRVESLCDAGPYAADTVQFRFACRRDSVSAREIRDYFRLDTLVKPSSPTWDNAMTLAAFIARNIPHANQQVYPKQCDAVGLWEYTRSVEPAFNCRLHSILLHELLLASGIDNRFVTCMPVDSLDSDCHVVNVVWLPEQEKWAMIDSDMQAYITDPEGTPLSLAEMREHYLADKPMEVHHLLGLDRNFSYYRAYWAKNLYWFACWEQTGYGKESGRRQSEGRMIYLVPDGFTGFNLHDPAVMTTDPARFWAATDTTELIN